MTQAEVIATLQVQADVDPALTCLVWSKLEEANPDFFLSYDVRLKLKDQIVAFNYLVEQQTRLLQKQRVGGLMMKYLSEWSRYKQLGSLPDNIPEPERSTAEMTLREILEVKGKVQLGHKRRVILDGLSCSVTRASPSAMDTDEPTEEEFDVEKLAPVLLKL